MLLQCFKIIKNLTTTVQKNTSISLYCGRVVTSFKCTITFAGVCIQIAGLKRMWSHNCFSRGAPWDNPSKYFANDKNCSRTALVIWTLDDWGKIIKKNKDKEKPSSLMASQQKYEVIYSSGSSLLNTCNLIHFYVIEESKKNNQQLILSSNFHSLSIGYI